MSGSEWGASDVGGRADGVEANVVGGTALGQVTSGEWRMVGVVGGGQLVATAACWATMTTAGQSASGR